MDGTTVGILILRRLLSLDVLTLMHGLLPQISLQQFPAVQPDHDEPSVTLRSIQRLFTFAFCFLIVDGLTPNDSHTNLTPPVTISQSFDQHACGKLFCCFLSVFFFWGLAHLYRLAPRRYRTILILTLVTPLPRFSYDILFHVSHSE